MRKRLASPDDQLLARLLGPPDLSEGVAALGYWTQRRRTLSWYRVRARREAAQMTRRWEQRVRGAMVSQRGAPINLRVSAGLLVARTALRRWLRRIVIATTVLIATAVAAAPIVASVALLWHLL